MNTKYLKYAIGEIILVVIGILIALSINNWNEKRKQKDKTGAILSQIIDELKIDIEVLQNVNKGYLIKDSLIKVYMASDFRNPSPANLDSSELYHLIRTYMPFEVHDRGFQLLMNHTDELEDNFAENLEQLLIIYQDALPATLQYMDGMLAILEKHKEYLLQNHDWFSSLSLYREDADGAFAYYMFNPIYKNYMSVYKEMYLNILLKSRWTIDRSIKAIIDLEQKLEIESSMGDYVNEIPEGLVQSMAGTYQFEEEESEIILENRNGKLYQATVQEGSFFGKAYDTQFITGELRYLGDSLFYHDVRSDLRLNADGSITIEYILGQESTSINKN